MMADGSLPSAGSAAPIFTDAAETTAKGGNVSEAQEALLVLGYNRTEILSALHTIDTAGMGTEDIIRAALKKLM